VDLFPPDEIKEEETGDSIGSGAAGRTGVSAICRIHRAIFSLRRRQTTIGRKAQSTARPSAQPPAPEFLRVPSAVASGAETAEGSAASITFREEKGNRRSQRIADGFQRGVASGLALRLSCETGDSHPEARNEFMRSGSTF
jgi:hypothetical protein